jgi:hypothetical protein
MAERVPLNRYKRVTAPLTRELSAVYTVPNNRAGIIINALVNNNSNENRTITVTLTSGLSGQVILNNFPLEVKDVINIFPNKLILTEFETLAISTDFGEDLYNFNNADAFWQFDIPTNTVTVSNVIFGLNTLTGTASANWGNNTATVGLTSLVPNNFSYTFANATGVNATLSILEAINIP